MKLHLMFGFRSRFLAPGNFTLPKTDYANTTLKVISVKHFHTSRG